MPENNNSHRLSNDIAYISNQNVFHSEMFGFKRDEVLSCIERISNENLERQKELEQTIAQLKQRLANAEKDNSTLLLKTKQVCDQLKNEQTRAELAVKEVNELRAQTEKAAEEAAELHAQITAREQEVISLKADNARLNRTINSLTASVSEYEAQQSVLKEKVELARAEADSAVAAARQRVEAAKREAEAQSQVIKAKAEDEARIITARARQEKTDSKKMISEAADNIAASIVVLKSQLASVDEKLQAATGNIQKASGCISSALGNTEKDLISLGVQMDKFPTPLPPVTMADEQMHETAPVMNFSQNPVQQEAMHAYQRAAYTQQNDAYDPQHEAYLKAQQDAYQKAQREEYERMQREAYERAQQEAYERQMQAEFEQRQRDMYQKAQRDAYEAQQRAVYEARQRAAYEESKLAAFNNGMYTTGMPYHPMNPYQQPYMQQQMQYPQPVAPYQNYAPTSNAPYYNNYQYQPHQQYRPMQQQFRQQPQQTEQSNVAQQQQDNRYVPTPAPIEPAPVDNYSQPPSQQNKPILTEEPLATYTPTRSEKNEAQRPHATGDVYAAQSAPEFTQQAPIVNTQPPYAPQKQSDPTLSKQTQQNDVSADTSQNTNNITETPIPQPEPVPTPAPIEPERVAQQSAPFTQQQAFSAPKGMHYQPPRRVVPAKRTQQPRQTQRQSLSDTLIDGLSNLIK